MCYKKQRDQAQSQNRANKAREEDVDAVDVVPMSFEKENKINEKNIWIGDTGASCHMTPSLEGMTDIKKINTRIKIGNGEDLTAEKVGTFRGNIEYANGKSMATTLKDVKYVPNLDCNLLSLTSVMDKGYQLLGTDEELSLKKNNMRIRFDRKLKTSGNLYGIKIQAKPRTKRKIWKSTIIIANWDI